MSPYQKGAMQKIVQQRTRFLSKNKMAVFFHKELVRGGYISDGCFWMAYKKQLRLEDVFKEQNNKQYALDLTIFDERQELLKLSSELNEKKDQIVEDVSHVVLEKPEIEEQLVEKINNHSINIVKRMCSCLETSVSVCKEVFDDEENNEKDQCLTYEIETFQEGEEVNIEVEPTDVIKKRIELFFELLRHFWTSVEEEDTERMNEVFIGLSRFYEKTLNIEENAFFVLSCKRPFDRASDVFKTWISKGV